MYTLAQRQGWGHLLLHEQTPILPRYLPDTQLCRFCNDYQEEQIVAYSLEWQNRAVELQILGVIERIEGQLVCMPN